jgi:polar amino acid transport system substrate-binding protein
MLWALPAPAAAAASSAPPSEPAHAMRLATLEWSPYVGPGLAENGLSSAIVSAAARLIDHSLRVEYYPWKRAMQVGLEDAGFAGYFPAYYTEERARSCHFSQPVGHSLLGLAVLKARPLSWESVPDLAAVRIGVVAGYSNGAEFDALAAQGRMQLDESPSDAINLKKLLAGRVRAVVIDRAVLRYLALTDPELAPAREQVVFHERPLARLSLHVCFQPTPAGQRLQEAFDAALKRIDPEKIENAYFQRLGAK